MHHQNVLEEIMREKKLSPQQMVATKNNKGRKKYEMTWMGLAKQVKVKRRNPVIVWIQMLYDKGYIEVVCA